MVSTSNNNVNSYDYLIRDLIGICNSHGLNNNKVVVLIGYIILLHKLGKLTSGMNAEVFLSLERELIYEGEIDGIYDLDAITHDLTSYKKPLLDKLLVCIERFNWDHISHNIIFERLLSFAYMIQKYNMVQPDEVTSLVLTLANIDVDSTKSIYNPFAGIASYGISTNNGKYLGQELDLDVWAIGRIRLLLNNVDCKFEHLDSIGHWAKKGLYDIVVSTPPFAYKLDRNLDDFYRCGSDFSHSTADSMFFERGLKSINHNGQVLGVIALRWLFDSSSKSKEFRKYLVDNGFISKVILLPNNLFSSTSIPIAIVVLDKKSNDGVVMVDGSTFFEKAGRQNVLKNEELLGAIESFDSRCVKHVSNKKIVANDFNLNPAIYVNTVSDVIEVPDGFELKKLRDVVSAYKGKRVENLNARFVRGKDLADGRFSFDKTFEDLQIEPISQKCTLLGTDLLLVLKIGNLKPTYFHHLSNIDVCCNPNVLTLEFNEGIYPQYLVNELGKDYVTKQVSARSGVGVMPSITLNNFLEVEVLVPDFQTQKAVFENDKQNNLLFKARELGLENHIAQLKSEYMAIVEDRQHDMRKHLRSLRYSNKQLKDYYVEHGKDINGVVDILSSQERAILTLSEMIAAFANEEQFGIAEKVNIDEFFTDLEINHKSEINYDVIYDIDSMALSEYGFLNNDDVIHNSPENLLKELYAQDISCHDLNVSIAPLDLTRLVSNIIGNAEMHSFTEHERTDYELRIDLTIDKERNMFQIDFRNNGTPFPLGLTKEFYGRRGKSAGKTKNKGTGGYVVKSICEHFGGDFDIYCDPHSNMPVTVRIYLPIFRDDEQI